MGGSTSVHKRKLSFLILKFRSLHKIYFFLAFLSTFSIKYFSDLVSKHREVKPKKAKKVQAKPSEVINVEEESLQERPETMKGRVKLPFKKKGRKSEEKKVLFLFT